MSTVDNRTNRDSSSARPPARRVNAEPKDAAKLGSAPQADTPSIGVASNDTAVRAMTRPSKSPVGSLGRWRIEVASPTEPAFVLSTDVSTAPSWSRHALQRYAPSLVSLIVHCLVVLMLGALTIASTDSRGSLLTGIFSEDAPPFTGEVITALEQPEPRSMEPPSIHSGGGDGLKDALASIQLPAGMNGEGGAGGARDVDDVLGGPFGSAGGLGAEELADVQGSKSANFYGLAAKGKRFVFVIDSSTSMWGPRWIDVRKELIRSIRKLEKDQYFFVVCFDVSSLSMFGAESIQKDFASATEENFRKLEYWLSQHTLGPGTRATTSLSEALRLKPDAIFLLTDGEFQDNVLQMLRTNNRNKAKKRKTTVNTIGFHSQLGAPLLSQIATENYGQFRYVAPPPNLPMVQPAMRFTGRVYPPQTMEELMPRF